MTICTQCVLPDTFPGIELDESGVCNYCKHHEKETGIQEKKQAIRKKFESLVEPIKQQPGYHCIVAYSGGKDSTFTLVLLRKLFGLRVLAVTSDHGYLSPVSIDNIKRIVDQNHVDHMFIKPRVDTMQKLFVGVTEQNPFPSKMLTRASGICIACMSVVKSLMFQLAIEKHIPLIAYGWSPGQASIGSSLFRLNATMLREMQESRMMYLAEIAGDDLSPYLLHDWHLDSSQMMPYNVHPLAFYDYKEEQYLQWIQEMGWILPKDTDGNSTNCLLNAYATRDHIQKYNYHPYAYEIANLVRNDLKSREDGLDSLKDLGNEAAATAIKKQLKSDIYGTAKL